MARQERQGTLTGPTGEIAWYETGPADGPVLVCCHGMGLDHRDLRDATGGVSESWRVLFWDMPGHGASGPLPADCSIHTMADALSDILDARAVTSFVLLGFSFGGMVAQALMRRAIYDVRGFIAYGCFAPFSSDAPLGIDAAESFVIMPILSESWPLICEGFAAACAKTAAGRKSVTPAIDRVGPLGLAAMSRALFGAFERDPSFVISVPMLIVRGGDDANGESLVQSANALLAIAPFGCEAVIKDAGHCAHLDRPEPTKAAIADFIRRFPEPEMVQGS